MGDLPQGLGARARCAADSTVFPACAEGTDCAIAIGMNRLSARLVQATEVERSRLLPGDHLIPKPSGVLTHAITVNCSRRELWPWLIQMGADRAGWYSYDALDNGGRRSAGEILRDFQNPPVGAVFPALPGRRDGFVLIERDPPNQLVLGWPSPTGGQMVTWAFVLDEVEPSVTRLLVRARASADYRFHHLPNTIGLWLAQVVHFIMERKQLVEVARRAERRMQTEGMVVGVELSTGWGLQTCKEP